jgi:hypothetical protein
MDTPSSGYALNGYNNMNWWEKLVKALMVWFTLHAANILLTGSLVAAFFNAVKSGFAVILYVHACSFFVNLFTA